MAAAVERPQPTSSPPLQQRDQLQLQLAGGLLGHIGTILLLLSLALLLLVLLLCFLLASRLTLLCAMP
jgi:hypothetical protein